MSPCLEHCWDFFLWLMGHDVLSPQDSDHDYRNFLQTHWSELLAGLPFSVHLCMQLLCSCVMHDWVFRNYPQWWFGQRCEGPVPWSVRPCVCVWVCVCVCQFCRPSSVPSTLHTREKLCSQIQQSVSGTKEYVQTPHQILSSTELSSEPTNTEVIFKHLLWLDEIKEVTNIAFLFLFICKYLRCADGR